MKYIAVTQDGIPNKIFHYLLGRQPSDGRLLFEDEGTQIKAVVFLDGRYFDKLGEVANHELQARFSKPVTIQKVLLWGSMSNLLNQYIPPEQGHMLKVIGPIEQDIANKLLIKYPAIGFDSSLPDQRRILKTDYEREQIRKAITITEEVYQRFVESLPDHIGKTERQVRVALLEQAVTLGADWESFPAIVATGINSAIPHHHSGESILGSGPLLIDMGYSVNGYCSDFTRTLWVGDVQGREKEKDQFDKVLALVQEAQKLAVAGVHVGATSGEIDSLARSYIIEQGYGEFFTHAAGHGVGLNIHELPHVSAGTDTVLQEGMVLTVEPGVYLSGQFGVRWEDIVFVDK